MHQHLVALSGYTEIHGVPEAVVKVWRALLWAALLSLLGSILYFFPTAWRERRSGELPEWVVWLYLGVALVVIRSLVVQFERWDEPLVLEEAPTTTIIVLVWLRSRFLRRGRW